jgi:hypothetical protein
MFQRCPATASYPLVLGRFVPELAQGLRRNHAVPSFEPRKDKYTKKERNTAALLIVSAKLERWSCVQVEMHGERAGSEVQMLTVRVPKEDSNVDTVLERLKEQLGSDYADKQLRLMEILFQKIYKVYYHLCLH